MFNNFRGGVHPSDRKEQTNKLSVEPFLDMEYVFIQLKQHIGPPVKPCVKIGEYVMAGQVIGKAEGVPHVHSSVSGNVLEIKEIVGRSGLKIKGVLIKNDKNYKEIKFQRRKMWENLNKKDFLKIICEAGISGMGGAMFPTFRKLTFPEDEKIEYLVINGAECEPYLNADNRLMIEKSKEIIEGIKIVQTIFKIPKVIIGIEDNKPKAIKEMNRNIEESSDIKIEKLKTKYPQGGEKQLLQGLFKKEMLGLPLEHGIIVLNTATCYAIYEAVVLGKPLLERIVTVAGEAVKNPKNLLVKLGTRIKDLLEYTDTNREKIYKLILGGPMMGIAVFNEEESIVKGSNGLLALTESETKPYKAKECISCGKCLDVCPMGLVPLKYVELLKNNKIEDMQKYNLRKCIRCSSCQYICPVNQPMMEAIEMGFSKR